MVGWDVAVHPLAGERFSVVLIDEQGHVMKTPDVGSDRIGYTHAAVIDVLRHHYGVPGEEARAMIAKAEKERLHEAGAA
jgi:hypothetical protein